MIAVLSGWVLRWRSRQLYEAFSSPSWNQRKKGALLASRVLVKGFCDSRFSFASLAQKPSKSFSASAHSLRYASMVGIAHPFEEAALGGNTRFSWRTDSIDFVVMRSSGSCAGCPANSGGATRILRPRRRFVEMEASNLLLVKILADSPCSRWPGGGIPLTIHPYGGPPRIAW